MQDWLDTIMRTDIAVTLAGVALIFFLLGRLGSNRSARPDIQLRRGVEYVGDNVSGQARVHWQPVDEELLNGKSIAAIKLYRDQTACGLKEAKEAVEARARALNLDRR